MRHIQNLLLVVGAMALGVSSFGLGMLCYAAATEWGGRGGPDSIGGAGVAILGLACSAVLGAIVGFVAAVRWIMTRKSEPWKPRIWCGVTIGILIGLALYFISRLAASPPKAGVAESWPVVLARGSELVDNIAYWPIAAVLTSALGMLGGVFAKFAGSPWDRHDGDQPRKGNEQP